MNYLVLGLLLVIALLLIIMFHKSKAEKFPGGVDGKLFVNETEEKILWTLAIDRDPDLIPQMKTITLEVITNPNPDEEVK